MIPLARPSIGDAERSAAQRVLSGTQLTNGPEVARFESAIASHASRAHGMAVSSGTAALELALWALDIAAGDTVLVTAFGFPAAANAVAARGATPIAVDVCEDSWLMDFAHAREAIDGKTKAIITIDQLGAVTRASDIESLEKDSGLPVISDAACGFGGADEDERLSGSAGRFATFSFHARKVVTTGEGGAIVCDGQEDADRLRALRNHGQVGPGRFASAGTNARLAECPSAIGNAQLARLEAMLSERRMLVDGYHERLAALHDAGKLRYQVLARGSRPAHQSFAIKLGASFQRDRVLAGLLDRNIGCGVATYSFCEIGVHHGGRAAPHARALHEQAVSLPLYIGMRSAELDRVAAALQELLS